VGNLEGRPVRWVGWTGGTLVRRVLRVQHWTGSDKGNWALRNVLMPGSLDGVFGEGDCGRMGASHH